MQTLQFGSYPNAFPLGALRLLDDLPLMVTFPLNQKVLDRADREFAPCSPEPRAHIRGFGGTDWEVP
jgi:hypothetical protein